MNMLKVAAIIPARGGSVGVPKKNVRPIGGKSLVQYAIETAKASKLINTIILSSDDTEIQKMGASENIYVHKRHPRLSTSKSLVLHTLLEISKFNSCDIIVLLQPTSPTRTAVDIDKAINKLLIDSRYNSVISVLEVGDNHPARMYSISDKCELSPNYHEFEQVRRQDLPKYYIRSGAIYAVRTSALLDQKTIMAKPASAIILDHDFNINIDTEHDFYLAELIYSDRGSFT
jgi:CMP-N,N'-diacetyllegionaminic acid synthase